jgi:hypothetical protein
MATTKENLIKPLKNYNGVSDGDVVARASSIQVGMTGNATFEATSDVSNADERPRAFHAPHDTCIQRSSLVRNATLPTTERT